MWARIDDDDFVVELVAENPEGRYHPSLRFVPVPEGWESYVWNDFWWDGESLREPEPGTLLRRAKAELKQAVTDKRWQVETGGLTLPPELGGARVLTATEDQNRIATAIQGMRDAGMSEVDFKAASGWVKLNLEQLVGISNAIAGHVQACFSAERAHHEAVDALTSFEDVSGYDFNQGWPS